MLTVQELMKKKKNAILYGIYNLAVQDGLPWTEDSGSYANGYIFAYFVVPFCRDRVSTICS